MIHTAFILGAGLGTRLRPLTEKCPKPLLPIGGQPIICHAMDRLLAAGIERFIINTHHCASVYDEIFPDHRYRGHEVVLVHEPVLLDTGGGLKNIEPFLGEAEKSLLVYNGDIFAEPDLRGLMENHAAHPEAEATLLLRSGGHPLNVRCNRHGVITDMRGRLEARDGTACLFAGIYCARRKFFAAMEKNKIESVVEVMLRRIVAEPGSVRGWIDNSGHWHDLGTVVEYERVNFQHTALEGDGFRHG